LLTHDGPVYHALSVHLSQASTIDMLWQNFLNPNSLEQNSRGKYPYYWRYSNSLSLQSWIGERKLPCHASSILSAASKEHQLTLNSSTEVVHNTSHCNLLSYLRTHFTTAQHSQQCESTEGTGHYILGNTNCLAFPVADRSISCT